MGYRSSVVAGVSYEQFPRFHIPLRLGVWFVSLRFTRLNRVDDAFRQRQQGKDDVKQIVGRLCSEDGQLWSTGKDRHGSRPLITSQRLAGV